MTPNNRHMHIALKQEVNTNTHCLYLYDDITDRPTIDWSTWEIKDSETSAKHIKDLLENIPDNDPINVFINSYGGDVAEGTAIFNLLKRHHGTTCGYVDGVAHSIAFTILQACDRRVYGEGTSSIIHNMWTDVCGNANELRKAADDLDKFMDSCVALYLSRSKNLDEKTLRKMLDDSTVLTPDDALNYGFADAVGEIPDVSEGCGDGDDDPDKKKNDDMEDDETEDPFGTFEQIVTKINSKSSENPEMKETDQEIETEPEPVNDPEPEKQETKEHVSEQIQINKGVGFNSLFDSAVATEKGGN